MALVNPNSKLETDCHTRFIEHCMHGGSIPEFCLEERISRKTFDRWCDTYPHMKEAKEMGKLLAEGWWLKQARLHLVTYSSKEEGSTKFDTNLYKHIVGGRFGHTGDREMVKLFKRFLDMQEKQKSIETGLTPRAEQPEYELIEESTSDNKT